VEKYSKFKKNASPRKEIRSYRDIPSLETNTKKNMTPPPP